jgi:hypothetical protein
MSPGLKGRSYWPLAAGTALMCLSLVCQTEATSIRHEPENGAAALTYAIEVKKGFVLAADLDPQKCRRIGVGMRFG